MGLYDGKDPPGETMTVLPGMNNFPNRARMFMAERLRLLPYFLGTSRPIVEWTTWNLDMVELSPFGPESRANLQRNPT
jgi:hypothetical protein